MKEDGKGANLKTWKTLAILPIALILFLIISFRAAISLGSSTAGVGEGRGREVTVQSLYTQNYSHSPHAHTCYVSPTLMYIHQHSSFLIPTVLDTHLTPAHLLNSTPTVTPSHILTTPYTHPNLTLTLTPPSPPGSVGSSSSSSL